MKNIGQNIQYKIEGDILKIEVNLAAPTTTSKSGKSAIIASTKGNKLLLESDGAVLGLNLYRAV